MITDYRILDRCRLCQSTYVGLFVDFGYVSLGNDLHATREDAAKAQTYPLKVMQCYDCGHFQLGYAVNPQVLYATNYTYLSSIGTSFVAHFKHYADWILQMCNLPIGSFIVDIGSNDGTCLKQFQDRGYIVSGVDPASLPAQLANDNGIETINVFFDSAAVEVLINNHGQADFVTSHNVLAHVDDLAGVFRNVHALLNDGGYFAFEVGYFLNVLENVYFDTIYHEHLDYHHAEPLVHHLSALGFDILDISINRMQGGSLRMLLRKTGEGRISDSSKSFLDLEKKSVIYDQVFLASWQQRIEKKMNNLRSLLRSRVNDGFKVIGYGAPTKATLFLKIAGISAEEIAFVVDDNRYKIGCFLPTTSIPILASNIIEEDSPDVIVLFAWNFADDIIAKISNRLSKSVEIIVPLPDLRSFRL